MPPLIETINPNPHLLLVAHIEPPEHHERRYDVAFGKGEMKYDSAEPVALEEREVAEERQVVRMEVVVVLRLGVQAGVT